MSAELSAEPSAAVTPQPEIRTIADRYVSALADHEPAAAQALGRNADARLADLSPEWAEARRALDESTAAELAAIDTASLAREDRTLHAALTERLASDISLFDTGFTTRLLAPLATPIHFVRESFDDVVVTDDARGDAIIERLGAVPHTVDELIRRLEWSRRQGDDGRFTGTGVAAARQVSTVAAQVASWVDPDGMDFFGSLATVPTLGGARPARLADAASAATRAFAGFERFLRDDLLPSAPAEDAVGEKVYQATARSFLGSELDLDEIYAYGWSELHRLVGESRALAAELTGSLADAGAPRRAAALLDTSGRYRLSGTVEITAWLQKRLDATLAAVDGTAFTLPAGIRDVDCVVTEAASGVVYYTPGAPDGSVRSKIVWTVPRGAGAISTWQDVTSFHHEGVPGHHLEHTVNRANAALHPWQRYLCEIHGYAEGWAHYSEELADELGLIHDTAERLGMKLGQIWRAVRIVADLGLHTGRGIPESSLTAERTWTTALARKLLCDLALTDPHTAGFEVDRYLGWPGQALAFKVGAKLWTDARASAQRRDGDAFSLPAFHRDALALGPMGLGPLRACLAE